MYEWISALLLSPATGEQKSVWPWIVGGIGLAALIAFVVLSVVQKKRASRGTPPTGPQGGDNVPSDARVSDEIPVQSSPDAGDAGTAGEKNPSGDGQGV